MNTQAPSVACSMNLLTRLSRVIYRRAVPALIGIKIKEFVALVYRRESRRATKGPRAPPQAGRADDDGRRQLRDRAERPGGAGPDRADPGSRRSPPAHRLDHP